MTAKGKTEAEIEVYLRWIAVTRTPLRQALFGFIRTVGTGFIASLAIEAAVRSE